MSRNQIPLYYSLPAIIISVLLVTAIVSGWTEPSSGPPNGETVAPLNTGSVNQVKLGALMVNANGSDNSNGFIVSHGNVGIGVSNPSQKLDVNGYVKGTGLCIGSDCRTAWPSGGSGGGLGGSGTGNYLARWAGTTTLIDSTIRDDGTYVGINAAPNSSFQLNVGGSVNATRYCINGANCISSWPSGGGGGITSISSVSPGGIAVTNGSGPNATLSLLTTCANGQILKYNGSSWVCANDDTGSGGGTSYWQLNGADIINNNSGGVDIAHDYLYIDKGAGQRGELRVGELNGYAGLYKGAGNMIFRADSGYFSWLGNNNGAGMTLDPNSIPVYLRVWGDLKVSSNKWDSCYERQIGPDVGDTQSRAGGYGWFNYCDDGDFMVGFSVWSESHNNIEGYGWKIKCCKL